KVASQVRQTGDIAARSRQRSHEACANRVSRRREDNRDDRRRLLCCEGWFGPRGENDIDLEPDKLGRDLGITLGASLPPAILDGDGAALAPAELAQPLHERGGPCALACRRTAPEESDRQQLARLLRARRERPRRRAAKQRDELAPPHSITLSARTTSAPGTSWPIALAVLR